MADDYKADDFRGAEGETFEVDLDGRKVGLILDHVQDLPPGMRESGSFRLMFTGPSDPFLAQGMYGFSRGGETREIFIVPISQGGDGYSYEAIFN